MTISIRQARIVLALQETGSVTAAARALNRAQTSVTKALQNLEASLDVPLFDRSARGVQMTAYGTAILAGATQAHEAFQRPAQLLPAVKLNRPATSRFFNMNVSEKWLDAFLATFKHRNVSAAATSLGLSATAVSSSLRKLEDCLDMQLFERTGTGLAPNPFSESLATNTRLARNFLRHAQDEIRSMLGNHTGQITVGTLPLARAQILPKAILALLNQHPEVKIDTTESPYPELVAGLRCGDVDFLMGALRGIAEDEDIVEQKLFDDPLSIIVRADHPLADGKTPSWRDMLKYGWVLPRHGTPTRALFEQCLKAQGRQAPERIVETSSLVILRGLLMNSDRLTVLSRHQINYEEAYGMLAALPVELPGTRRAIGLTRRKKGTISPTAELLIKEIRKVAPG